MQCNNWLKFGKLFDYADSVGAEFVATGHYARLAAGAADAGRDAGLAARVAIAAKDQSYVLFGVERRAAAADAAAGRRVSRSRRFARWPRELGLRVADEEGQPGDLLRDPRASTTSSCATRGAATATRRARS